jgi:acetyl-CoA C-acetyltransferase
MVSHPIGSLDGRPLCDGACALLLASEERARALTDRPVWITGMGSCYEAHNLGDRDLAEPRALTRAAGDAMGMAGVADPAAQIDILEISDHFSYQLPLWAEGLGLCGPGGGPAFLEAESGGRGPAVNRSGGLLRGVPRYVAGADRVTEAFRQLRGEAPGGAPLAEARRALAHGTSGPAGQHQCVIILERGF